MSFLNLETCRSAVELVDSLIERSFAARASDIHLDPSPTGLKVRLRIDGLLQETAELALQTHPEIIARLKIMAGLRIDEHQEPQDGRFRFELAGHDLNVRVSILPTYYGLNAVLRLLSDKDYDLHLGALGFYPSDLSKIESAIAKSSGLILVTGPTGSGKTTTLYALMKILNRPAVSIVTLEDPIEYSLPGIRQIPVRERSGLNFANGLRSVLRQDPNVIMVGEIRDRETATLSVNAALTGHLVLSTLHTNDVSATLPRLLEMGIEPFLLASTFTIAINQRLVRKICGRCRRERQASFPSDLKFLKDFAGQQLFEGGGCNHCGGSGYFGRAVISEILLTDEEIRAAILNKKPVVEIRQLAKRNGLKTLLEDGLEKIKNGQTTLEEVLRVVHE